MLRKNTTAQSISFFTSSSGFITKDVFVIVGGLSAGKHIAPLLRGHGYSAVHVMPKRAQALNIKHNEADYITSFTEDDDLQLLVEQLSAFTIRAIIPGCESGVYLADQLNDKLKLTKRNDISTLDNRTNKFLMQETLKKANIRSANQILINEFDPLLEWVNKNGYPVVLKPEESAGTDGVFICRKEEDIRTAFHSIMSNKSVHGFQNNHVVAQEMLIGDEFMVNTVSDGDAILVTDIILGKKTTSKSVPLYDYTLNINSDNKRYNKIADYVKQVLPVLGLHYGAAHTEVIVTKNGPTLVEINCRLTGAFDMSATMDSIGTTQVEALVNSYIKSNYIKNQTSLETKASPKTTLTSCFIAPKSDVLLQDPDFSFFTDIPGFHSIKFGARKGSTLPMTTSLMNIPGEVVFVGDNEKMLMQSHELFRQNEQKFYEKAFSTPTITLSASKHEKCQTTSISLSKKDVKLSSFTKEKRKEWSTTQLVGFAVTGLSAMYFASRFFAKSTTLPSITPNITPSMK